MFKIDKSSFIAPSAVLIGDVTIGKHCGVYPHAVIRGDQNLIEIGAKFNRNWRWIKRTGLLCYTYQ